MLKTAGRLGMGCLRLSVNVSHPELRMFLIDIVPARVLITIRVEHVVLSDSTVDD